MFSSLLIKFLMCVPFCIVVGLAFNSCDSSSTYPHRHINAVCDTTITHGFQWVDDDSVCTTMLINCTFIDTVEVAVVDTLFVATPPDTIVVTPDFDCVADCLEVNGLGHWRECLSACLPAQ